MNETMSYVLAALIGSLPALFALWRSGHKEKAEVDKTVAEAAGEITETAMELLRSLKERVDELERLSRQQAEDIHDLGEKLEKSYKTIRVLLRGMATLIHQVTELGATPAFVIPVYDGENDVDRIERALMHELGD